MTRAQGHLVIAVLFWILADVQAIYHIEELDRLGGHVVYNTVGFVFVVLAYLAVDDDRKR